MASRTHRHEETYRHSHGRLHALLMVSCRDDEHPRQVLRDIVIRCFKQDIEVLRHEPP